MAAYTIGGQRVEVDDGLSRAGAVDLMRQQGILTAEQAAAEVGEEVQRAETSGAAEDFLIGAGQSFAERSFGLVPSDVEPPEGVASTVGGIAPLVAASFAVPGSGLAGVVAQGALAGILEAIREGSSAESIGGQAALAGAGAGVFNVASRVGSGLSRIARGAGRQQPILTTATTGAGKSAVRTLRGAGGGSRAVEQNQLLINRQAAKAIGQEADNISGEVLGNAADDIGGMFNRAVPDDLAIDVTKARSILDGVDFAGKERILAGRDGTQLTGKAWKALTGELRAKSSVLKHSQKSDIAEELDIAIEAFNQAAEAGSDLPLLSTAREQWKVFKNLEEINQVIETGNVPAGQLMRKFGRENRKGFGTNLKRDRLTHLSDDTQKLIDTTRKLASDKVPVGSPTASRLLQFGPGGVALGGLATGQLNTQQAAGLALLGAAPTVLGPAAFGQSLRFAGQSGGALGQSARDIPKLIKGLLADETAESRDPTR